VADSLTAIKHLVFDEKKVTIQELLEAMESNWQGKEDIQQMCLHAPKYGNDRDEADEMARWVHQESQKILGNHRDYWGGKVRSQGALTSAYYSFGRACQATPDGRFDSEPLADGTCSPMAGRDTQGPTATLNSAAKIDPLQANEMLLNQKFMPSFLEGDKNVLLDAQEHPEKYPDLVVRVAGYSSYWVDLGKPMQDDIIRRTEQNLGGGC